MDLRACAYPTSDESRSARKGPSSGRRNEGAGNPVRVSGKGRPHTLCRGTPSVAFRSRPGMGRPFFPANRNATEGVSLQKSVNWRIPNITQDDKLMAKPSAPTVIFKPFLREREALERKLDGPRSGDGPPAPWLSRVDENGPVLVAGAYGGRGGPWPARQLGRAAGDRDAKLARPVGEFRQPPRCRNAGDPSAPVRIESVEIQQLVLDENGKHVRARVVCSAIRTGLRELPRTAFNFRAKLLRARRTAFGWRSGPDGVVEPVLFRRDRRRTAAPRTAASLAGPRKVRV